MRTTIVPIRGMSCQGCVAAITNALQSVPGVQRVEVRLSDQDAVLTIDDEVSNQAIDAAIERAGFTPGPRQAQA